MNTTRKKKETELLTPAQTIALLLLAILVSLLINPFRSASGETLDENSAFSAYWGEDVMILDDPEYFMFFEEDSEEESIPVITSAGKTNLKINGVKSKDKLLRYTVPERLLQADPDFLALMIEAEKYIGYPYVYGGSTPKTSFDCSGFVCWVFTKSGVYPMNRCGANGLYGMCTDIPREEARPGDLVFFEKTMSGVKGITHVGIYVGNNMMIHAGDPIGFADLQSRSWSEKIYAFGRLPIQ